MRERVEGLAAGDRHADDLSLHAVEVKAGKLGKARVVGSEREEDAPGRVAQGIAVFGDGDGGQPVGFVPCGHPRSGADHGAVPLRRREQGTHERGYGEGAAADDEEPALRGDDGGEPLAHGLGSEPCRMTSVRLGGFAESLGLPGVEGGAEDAGAKEGRRSDAVEGFPKGRQRFIHAPYGSGPPSHERICQSGRRPRRAGGRPPGFEHQHPGRLAQIERRRCSRQPTSHDDDVEIRHGSSEKRGRVSRFGKKTPCAKGRLRRRR